MRILFLSHYFPPEGNAPASRTHAHCRRWVQSGHEVTVITSAPNVPSGIVYPGYKNRLWQREVIDGIQTVRIWTFLAPNKGTIRRTLNYLSFMLTATIAGLFVSRPDVILATSPQFFNGWAGVLLSKLRRLPFVLEIRDIWPESIEAVGAVGNRFALRSLAWLERRLYSAANHIVTVGEGYRQKLTERGVPPAKVTVISNGVERDLFSPRPASARLKAQYALDGAFVCSYVGTVGMAAGLEIVLRAAAKLKARQRNDVRFLIAGDGAALADLQRRAKSEGLESVIFTGRQPKEAIPDLLAVSDVCLVHLKNQTLFETVMPSKIFEALAMARPIILGVKGRAAAFLKTAGGGLCIEPENEDALLGAIDEMRTQPAIFNKAGKQGRQYVIEHFDRDRLAQDYLRVLESTSCESATWFGK